MSQQAMALSLPSKPETCKSQPVHRVSDPQHEFSFSKPDHRAKAQQLSWPWLLGEPGSTKSKKKKEGKDEKGDDEVNEDCSGVGGKLVGNDWSVGPTYTYEEMLIRMYKIIEDKNPSLGTKERYVLKPPQTVRVGSKKVAWVNFSELCVMMKRPVEHVVQSASDHCAEPFQTIEARVDCYLHARSFHFL
ncbi:unnamed protein product [Polarella glacialis]|uniref:Eukaryotic translation initiation factor 2 subunit beta n=1 Tax=Polarella glacialis TaxID=89957 RepID=A0A813KJR1_POLGL|nr:unnamed protein product [Polarella glacialis]